MSAANVVVFTAGGSRCALTPDVAAELASRLRARSGDDVLSPAVVVAVRIELCLQSPQEGRELRLLDSETNALSWTIEEWLRDLTAAALPEGIRCLRYALEGETRVDVAYREGVYRLPSSVATALAESLRLKAAGELGSETARRVADAIEDVLVGRREGPVRLEDDGAEEVFLVLSAWSAPPVAELYSLFEAVRAAHDARLS